MVNNTGSKIEPCEIPLVTGRNSVVTLFTFIHCYLSISQFRSLRWSTVSKAFDRLTKRAAQCILLSTVDRISFKTRAAAADCAMFCSKSRLIGAQNGIFD